DVQQRGAFLANRAGMGRTGRTVGGRFERGVPKPAVAALGENSAIAEFSEIGQQRYIVFVENLGALRDLEHNVGASRAGAVLAHTVTTGFGFEMLLVAIIDQGVETIDAFGD